MLGWRLLVQGCCWINNFRCLPGLRRVPWVDNNIKNKFASLPPSRNYIENLLILKFRSSKKSGKSELTCGSSSLPVIIFEMFRITTNENVVYLAIFHLYVVCFGPYRFSVRAFKDFHCSLIARSAITLDCASEKGCPLSVCLLFVVTDFGQFCLW